MNTSTRSALCVKQNLPDKTYRHELKYELNRDKAKLLRARLRLLLPSDANAGPNDSYLVKSLYFDTPDRKDYLEKELGLACRQKIRLRGYGNGDLFKLEIKRKVGDVATKYVTTLSRSEAEEVAAGQYHCLLTKQDPQALLIYEQLKTYAYRPFAVIFYTRSAYTRPEGNLRITFDEDLRYSPSVQSLFDPAAQPASASLKSVVEIKYDDFAPIWLTNYLVSFGLNASENSKYSAVSHCLFD